MHMKKNHECITWMAWETLNLFILLVWYLPLRKRDSWGPPGWVVPKEAACSGDVFVCLWDHLGDDDGCWERAAPQRGWTSPGRTRRALWKANCINFRCSVLLTWVSVQAAPTCLLVWEACESKRDYCFTGQSVLLLWVTEFWVMRHRSQQDLSCPLIQPFFWDVKAFALPFPYVVINLYFTSSDKRAPSWGFQVHVCVTPSLESLSQEFSFVSPSSAHWAPRKQNRIPFLWHSDVWREVLCLAWVIFFPQKTSPAPSFLSTRWCPLIVWINFKFKHLSLDKNV